MTKSVQNDFCQWILTPYYWSFCNCYCFAPRCLYHSAPLVRGLHLLSPPRLKCWHVLTTKFAT